MHKIKLQRVVTTGAIQLSGKVYWRATCSCGYFEVEGSNENTIRMMAEAHSRLYLPSTIQENVPSFIDELHNDNTELTWTFFTSAGTQVIGSVVTYRVTSDSIPITITIQTEKEGIFELPWISIQAIQIKE